MKLNTNTNNNNNNFIFFKNSNTSSTPNEFKIEMMLIELGVSYEFKLIDEFVKNNPNKRIPSLIDNSGGDEPFIIYENGSVLLYLANKFSKFLPNFKFNENPNNKSSSTLTKSVWQIVNLTSFFNNINSNNINNNSFNSNNSNEVIKVLKLLDDRLSTNQYIGGSDFSIADIANVSWIQFILNNQSLKERFIGTPSTATATSTATNFKQQQQQQQSYNNIFKWFDLINQRESNRILLTQ